jgi:hypothetical protein
LANDPVARAEHDAALVIKRKVDVQRQFDRVGIVPLLKAYRENGMQEDLQFAEALVEEIHGADFLAKVREEVNNK